MAGNNNSGRKGKSVEQHKLDGTYRADRHGPAPGSLELKAATLGRKPTKRAQKKWIRSAADERAVANGCWFSEKAGKRTCDFFSDHLRHAKGRDFQGRPFDLLPWQRDDLVMPLFGWRRADGRRRFTNAYIEIPKKNGKSTIAAGIALYMLTADGEPGAHVYVAASDRDQASIIHGEAIAMAEASPTLDAILKCNKTQRNIAYPNTNSLCRALSGVAKGKEGYDGSCCIIDELHDWYGRKVWDQLLYMGSARPEFLRVVLTTAGEDMQSSCREQHDYVKRVLDGSHTDDRCFGLIYSADPKTEDLTSIKVARKANPSLGTTMREDDFLADMQVAQTSTRTWNTFLRYRYNIWGVSENSWLDQDHWKNCYEDYTEQDLEGCFAYGGLDLARTRDLTALALIFASEAYDEFWQLHWFWMPEAMAQKNKDLADYLGWAEASHLTLTPGDVCDYDIVLRDIVAISKRFDIRQINYDPYNAEQLTQKMTDKHGIPRQEFKQTAVNFAAPTSEYERLVIAGLMHHNGHPVTTWQSENVNVRTDDNGNLRPVKAKHGDIRTIDGIVGSIMGLAEAISAGAKERESVYQRRGVITL